MYILLYLYVIYIIYYIYIHICVCLRVFVRGVSNFQSSKFGTKCWAEVNDDARGAYDTNSDIKFNTIMLYVNYGDTYIFGKRIIIISVAEADAVAKKNKQQ